MGWDEKKCEIEAAVILRGVLGLEDTREPDSARRVPEPVSWKETVCLLSGRFNEVPAPGEDAAMSLGIKLFGWPYHDNQLRLRERGCSSGLVGGSTIVVATNTSGDVRWWKR